MLERPRSPVSTPVPSPITNQRSKPTPNPEPEPEPEPNQFVSYSNFNKRMSELDKKQNERLSAIEEKVKMLLDNLPVVNEHIKALKERLANRNAKLNVLIPTPTSNNKTDILNKRINELQLSLSTLISSLSHNDQHRQSQ